MQNKIELWILYTAPDNCLKQGVAYALLGAKSVFLQNPEVFPFLSFYIKAFLEVADLVLGKKELPRTIGHTVCRHRINTCIFFIVTSS